MTRLILLVAAFTLLAVTPATALTDAQLRDQADVQATWIALGFSSEVAASAALQGHLDLEDDHVIGDPTHCRRTTRLRGSCRLRLTSTATGSWCTAVIVVRQRGRLLITTVRDYTAQLPGAGV